MSLAFALVSSKATPAAPLAAGAAAPARSPQIAPASLAVGCNVHTFGASVAALAAARSAQRSRARRSAKNTATTIEQTVTQAVLRQREPLFDPLGLTQDADTYKAARDVEMHIGRFAMLGAVGYPTAELYHDQIAETLGLPAALAKGGQAPHVLNGGGNVFIDAIVFISLAGMLATVGETAAHRSADDKKWQDPLNPRGLHMSPMLSPTLRCLLREAQRVNGRAAMISILGMWAVEAYTGQAVVDVTPFLFGVA